MPRPKSFERDVLEFAERYVKGLVEESYRAREDGVRLPPLFLQEGKKLGLLLGALNMKREARASRGRY